MKYLIIIVAAGIIACQEIDRRKLVWSDEFNTPGKPDDTKWSYDLGNGENGWGNNELEYYTNDAKNVRVENGNLVIEAVKESKGGFNYTSTRILSKNKGD